MKDQLGIDEAGRGPVLGPMVLAGLWVNQSDLPLLKSLQVQDSKLFANNPTALKRRKSIAIQLMADFQHHLISVDAQEIDQFVSCGPGLNALEQEKASKIIHSYPAKQVILDGATLFGPLVKSGVQAQNKADRDFLVVAGASIIAKEARDQQLKQLFAPYIDRFGPILGGGYANGQTLLFVNWHLQEYGELPPFYRQSYHWKALKP